MLWVTNSTETKKKIKYLLRAKTYPKTLSFLFHQIFQTADVTF